MALIASGCPAGTRWSSSQGCGHPTTWIILQQDGPDHLALWYNALPEHQMAPITSGCAPSQAAVIVSHDEQLLTHACTQLW